MADTCLLGMLWRTWPCHIEGCMWLTAAPAHSPWPARSPAASTARETMWKTKQRTPMMICVTPKRYEVFTRKGFFTEPGSGWTTVTIFFMVTMVTTVLELHVLDNHSCNRIYINENMLLEKISPNEFLVLERYWPCTRAQCEIITWRHNDHDGVSNHQPHGCLLNRLFRRRSKKTSKLCVTGLYAGNSPVPVNSPHKGPVTRKMFPFDDVIMMAMHQAIIRHI